MDREKAFEALKLRVESQDIILHSLAVEAIMRALARHLHEDVELWGLPDLFIDLRVNGDIKPMVCWARHPETLILTRPLPMP